MTISYYDTASTEDLNRIFRDRRARKACVILGCEETTSIQSETGAYYCPAHGQHITLPTDRFAN